jgi:hypothetical protein
MREGYGMRGWWLLILALPVCGAVDGVVVNATTGKPQPSVMVTLVQPGQSGMQTIATVKSDAEGNFKIDKTYPPGPALLQTLYSGVIYNQIITPGSPTTGVKVNVYDSTTNPDTGKISQHMIVIEPAAEGIQVTETFLFDNQTKLSFSDPAKGSARFFLPKAAAGQVKVMVNTSGGMPIPRDAAKTKEPDIYKVDYPVKPGETRFDASYTLPAGDAFVAKNLDPASAMRLVTPKTVTLTGEGIDDLGQEPQTQAHIYNVRTPTAEVTIAGTGSLRDAEAGAAPEEDLGQPKIEQAPARVYTKMAWVLGLTLGMLALGGAMLFRKGTV